MLRATSMIKRSATTAALTSRLSPAVVATRAPFPTQYLSTSAGAAAGRTPMPRVLPGTAATSSVPTANAADDAQPKRRPWLVGLGLTIMGLCTLDSWLVFQDERDRKARMKQLSEEEAKFREELMNEWQDKPTIYYTKAVFKYKMGGTMGLRGVVVGDMLEVLDENVGPKNQYSLCRTRNTETGEIASIGWYPMEFMEKMATASTPEEESPTPKRRKFLGLF